MRSERRGLALRIAVIALIAALAIGAIGGLIVLYKNGAFDGWLTPNDKQRATCQRLGGKIGNSLEDDQDANCDRRVQRQVCNRPGESIVSGLPFGRGTDIVTCRIDIRPNGDVDTD